MCGLIGMIHKDKNVCESIYSGLEYLQYRGYDSCGIALIEDGDFYITKQTGSIKGLKKNCRSGQIGLGHTRWATHGCISIRNTHPFVHDNLSIIHNGIIENYAEVKEKYGDYEWKTGSDTEVILKSAYEYLNEYRLNNPDCDQETAEWDYVFEQLEKNLEGSFAVAFLDKNYPDKIFFMRRGLSPLSIAVSDDFAGIASDCIALSEFADHVIDIEDGQYGFIKVGQFCIKGCGEINKKRHIIKVPKLPSEKSHDTWFEHEFDSQPMVLSNALHKLNNAFTWPDVSPKIIDIVGCGSALYAGCVGKYWIEKYANVLCRVNMSSEWVDVPGYDRVMALFSQSGETADTLSVFKRMSDCNKLTTMGFVNTFGSTLSRSVDHIIPTFVGQEISVASTKAMTGQMLSSFLWANKLANINMQDRLLELFEKMSNVIDYLPKCSRDVVDVCSNVNDLFLLSKGNLVPIAYEGALKIKELAYIHAEAMSASELKHGPLAMISKEASQAVVFLAPSSSCLWKKMISAVEEVQSRGGNVIIVSDKPEVFQDVCCSIKMPYIDEDLAPFLYVLPMQWLAYSLGIRKGNQIDMPRNLAKSVTVE